MKKNLSIILLFVAQFAVAQSFLGVHTSNYDPVKASFFNPAAPATSYLKWEVSLAGFDVHVAQNYLKLGDGFKSFSDFDNYEDNFQEILNGEDKDGNIAIDIPLLGFSLQTKKAGTFHFNTRSRVLIDFQSISEEMLSSVFNDPNNIYNWAANIQDDNVGFNVHAFSEIGIGYSRKVFEKGKHKLSAGGTVKLIIPGFSADVNGGLDINVNTAAESANFGNTNISAISSDVLNAIEDDNYNYKFGIKGFGLDLGAIYEWKNGEDEIKVVSKNKLKTKINPNYRLKAGFAVLDIGRAKYEHSRYSRTFISDGSTVSLDDITVDADSAFIDFDVVLNDLGSFQENEGSFKTKLPTALSMFIDARLTRTLYVNASALVNMGKTSDGTPKARTQSIISVTPRFELPMVGVYIPASYNFSNGFELGASFRFSQFVIGSSNIFSYLWSKNATNIDLQFAMMFGGVHRKGKKNAKKKAIDDEEMLLQDGNN